MQDKQKSSPKSRPAGVTKPLVTQIVDAVIDGAADLAKGVAIDAVQRVAKSAKKTEVGKAAVSLARKVESLAPKKPAKKAALKKSAAKKTPAKKVAAKKAAKKTPSSVAKKSRRR